MNDAVSAKTKRSMLIAAGVLIIAAVVWFVLLETTTYTKAACDRINAFGYDAQPKELRILYHGENTSISEYSELDYNVLVPLSEACGFGSDINKVGSVELYGWEVDPERSISIWFVDRQPELVYMYDASKGEYLSIDRK